MLAGRDSSRVSVVLVHRGGSAVLDRCLSSLMPTLPPDGEVIVVDNDSQDESVQMLRRDWPAVRVIEAEYNAGFAAGCNIGAREASAATVIFLNNDTVVNEGWWEPVAAAVEADDAVAIAGGLTLFLGEPSRVNSAGARLTLSGAALDLGFGLAREQVDLRERDVAVISGVSMAVDAGWFGATGGFDEEFFMYFEDVELSVRAWLEGRRVRFVPQSVVLHEFGATSGVRSNAFRNRLASRNRLLIVARLWPPALMAPAMVACVVQDLLVSAHLAVAQGPWAGAAAVSAKGRGVVEACRMAGASARRRRSLKRRRTRSLRVLRDRGLLDRPAETVREFVRMRRL